jgi:hypothetical protein
MALDLFKLYGEVSITGLDSAERGLVRLEGRAKGTAKGLDQAGGSARRLTKDLAAAGAQGSIVGRALEDRLGGVASRVPLIGQPLAEATREMFNLGTASEKHLGGIVRDAERAAQKLALAQAQAAKVRDTLATRRSDFGENLKINYGGKLDPDFLLQFRQAEDAARRLQLLTEKGIDPSFMTRVERSAFQFSKLERDGVKAVTAVEDKVGQAATALAGYEAAAEGAAAGTGALAGASAGVVVGVGLVAAAAIASGALVLKSAKDYSDYAGAIKDVAQESGLAAPTVSTVGAYARLAGTEVGRAASAVEVYFKNISSAAHGNREMSKTFERFGIDAKKALTDPDQAARDLFDHLAKIRNPAERLEVAFGLAGKSGKVLANIAQEMGGSFADAERAAHEWGVVLSDEDVEAADKFGDGLEVLKMRAEGALYRIGKVAIPELQHDIESLSATFISNRGVVEGWGVGVVDVMRGARLAVESDVGAMIAKVLYFSSILGQLGQLKAAAPEWASEGGIALLNPAWALARNLGRAGAADRALDQDLANETARLQSKNSGAVAPPAGIPHVGGGGGGRKGGGGKKSKDLTSLYEALSDAEAGRLMAGLTSDVTKLKAGLDAQQSVLDAGLRAQTVSVRDYWEERERITLAGLDAEITLLRSQKRSAAEGYQEKFAAIGADKKLSAEERTLKQQQESARWAEKNYQLEGQIAEAVERRSAAMKTIPLEAAAAARELEKTMSGVRADFLEAGGDTVGAAYARIADKFREMHEVARANGQLFPDADKWVTALERSEKLAANLARLGERADLGRGHLSLETARIQDRITDGVVSEREGRRQIYELELKYRDLLRGVLAESLAVAKVKGDEKAILSIEEQIRETERLGHVIDSTKAKARGIFEGAFSHGLDELKGGLGHAAATFGIDLVDAVKREMDARLTKVISEALFGKNDEFGSDSGLIGKALEKIGLGGIFGGKGKGKTEDPSAKVSATLEKTAQETQGAFERTSGDQISNRDWNTDRILDALRQLDETMESMRPQQQGFLSGLAGAALGGFVGSLGSGLASRVGGGRRESTQGYEVDEDTGTYTRPRRVNPPPGHALGAMVSATAGGKLIRVAEGGYDELVLTTDPRHRARSEALLASYMARTGIIPHFAAGGYAGAGAGYVPPPVRVGDSRRPGGGGRAPVYVDVRLNRDSQGRIRSKDQVQVEIYQGSADSARRNG